MSLNSPGLSGLAGSAALERDVKIADADYTMAFSDDVVIATGDFVITLPPGDGVGTPAVTFGPNPSSEYRIVAEGGGCSVDGNGFPINGSVVPLVVAPFGALIVNWDEENQTWVGDGGGTNASGATTQAVWFIDFIHGNNANSGKTANTALKTFQNWQARVEDDQLNPTGGILAINIIGNLGPNDEITWKNDFGTDCAGVVTGSKKVLAQGNLTAFTTKNASANIPYKVSGAIAWSNFIGKYIQFTNGPAAGTYAYIAKELVPGVQAQISELVQDPAGGIFGASGIVQPALALPVAGNHFQIVDFSNVTVGTMKLGADNSGTPSLNNGLYFQFLNVGGQEFAYPALFGDAFFCAVNCIMSTGLVSIDSFSNVFFGSVASNCCFSGGAPFGIDLVGRLFLVAGLFVNDTPLNVQSTGALQADIEPMFIVGNNGGLANAGKIQIGPASYWDAAAGIQVIFCGVGSSTDFSAPLGASDTPALWGTGNDTVFNITQQARVHMFTVSTGITYVPPSITAASFLFFFDAENTGAPNVPADQLSNVASTIGALTQVVVPAPVLRTLSWANLFALQAAGGFGYEFFENVDAVTKLFSNAVRSDLDNSINIIAFHN